MIRILLFVLLLGPVAAQARVLAVQTGEHKGFTRLVLSPGPGTDWSFGRTDDGYELRLGPPGTAFDLSRVYDLIGRNRLAAIQADPGTGALRLRVGCACHAMPYELGGGVLVIDLRDGPAPEGSSFEASLAGAAMPPLGDPAQPRPQPRLAPAYDWLSDRGRQTGGVQPPLAMSDLLADDSLRQGLLRQLADGAARTIVTMTLPERRGNGLGAATPLPQIRVGEDLGLIVIPGGGLDDPRKRLTPQGLACVSDADLDLGAWLVDPDPATGLALVRNGLVGEFDAPDASALTTAVRYLIAIGFGAEARQMIDGFAMAPVADRTVDLTVLTALTHGVDGEPAPEPRFGAMAGCDTAAALWAAIETTGGPLPRELNDDAVVRAFSALPPGLRRHLGGDLTARLLAAGRVETARALTDAVRRLPGDDAATRLGAARIDLALGDGPLADETLQAVAERNGPVAADALVALAETRAVSGTAMTAEQIGALSALSQEYRGTSREPGLRRAAVLGMALGGDFDGAFAAAVLSAPAKPDLWRLLATRGSDAAVLTHAVVGERAAATAAAPEDRRRLAERLLTLGLPDAALTWLPATPQAGADRLLAAAAHLARQDGLSALRLVDGTQGSGADLIRARAEAGLGAPDRASAAYARLGDAEAALGQARRAGDWQAVAEGDDAVWAAAARLVSEEATAPRPSADAAREGLATDIAAALTAPSAQEPDGPLARGAARVAESVAARAAVEMLLATVPMPDAASVPGVPVDR